MQIVIMLHVILLNVKCPYAEYHFYHAECHSDKCRFTECHFYHHAECRYFNVIFISVIMLNVLMLSVIFITMLSAVILMLFC